MIFCLKLAILSKFFSQNDIFRKLYQKLLLKENLHDTPLSNLSNRQAKFSKQNQLRPMSILSYQGDAESGNSWNTTFLKVPSRLDCRFPETLLFSNIRGNRFVNILRYTGSTDLSRYRLVFCLERCSHVEPTHSSVKFYRRNSENN